MTEAFFTVDQVAERLKLHNKTVLRLIHEGRLQGTRVGKSYRILCADLETFAAQNASYSAYAPQARVTSIIELPDVSAELARQLLKALQAELALVRDAADEVRLDSAYDPQQRQLKLVLFGNPADSASLLQGLQVFLDDSH